jgi:hypothetical protein
MLVDERMEHVNKIRWIARKTNRPPTIEFDPSIDTWYVRFRRAKVARTISAHDKPGPMAVIDLDVNNEVIGLELIGVREFSIAWLRRNSPVDLSEVDFERARFVHAANCVAA